jgi:hypothetical protein
MIKFHHSDWIWGYKIMYNTLEMHWIWLQTFRDKKIRATWKTILETAEKMNLVLIKNKLWKKKY